MNERFTEVKPLHPLCEFSRYFTENNRTHFPKLLVEALSAWSQEADMNNLAVAE